MVLYTGCPKSHATLHIVHIAQVWTLHGAFKKFPDWFYLKTIRSDAVFVLFSVRSSYSPVSKDMITSVKFKKYMKI